MSTVFEPLIADCRAGYWYHVLTRQLGAGNPFVRLPPRAAAFEQFDISYDNGSCWEPLSEALEAEAQDWERIKCNKPQAYVLRGSTAVLLPAAASAEVLLRAKVIIRPSELVTPQAAGIITNINTTTRVLTVTSLPQDKKTNVVISGNVTLDAIEPANCYELSLFDAPCTVQDDTHVLVLPGPTLMRMQQGDYLRVANQSDWPQIMHSYHHLLGSAAAVPICRQRDLNERADILTDQVRNALMRYQDFLKPRVRIGTHTPIQHGWSDD